MLLVCQMRDREGFSIIQKSPCSLFVTAGDQGCDYLVELVCGEDLDQVGAGEGSEAFWEFFAAQKLWILELPVQIDA